METYLSPLEVMSAPRATLFTRMKNCSSNTSLGNVHRAKKFCSAWSYHLTNSRGTFQDSARFNAIVPYKNYRQTFE